MSLLTLHDADGYRYFDPAECRAAGERLADAYRAAAPFPHVAIDDFLDPATLRAVARDFPDRSGKAYFDRDQERLKYQYKPQESRNRAVRNLLAELNSEAFLGFLAAMTGIEGLIADPYFIGGGLHEIMPGGHLSVHADFNIHNEMKVERRLNLLVYLNEDWDPAYGGELELWDRGMGAKVRSVAPLLGRAVVFNTAHDSFHGHPEPLACPPGRSRRSIATYYYTAFEADVAAPPARSTNFRPRPGSADKRDWAVAYGHFVSDWVPARLQRYARRLGPRG